MVKMDSEVHQTQLTSVKWHDWYVENLGANLAEYFAYDDYAEISESPKLMSDFLAYPLDLQKILVEDLVDKSVDIDKIATIGELRYRLNNSGSFFESNYTLVSYIDWSLDTLHEIRKFCREKTSEVSGMQLTHQIETDLNRLTIAHLGISKTDYVDTEAIAATDEILWLLIAVFGPDRMLYFIRLWLNETDPTQSISNLLLFIDNYEEYKEYPVKWTLELLLEGEK